MTLKLIPVENISRRDGTHSEKKQKHFNPGNQMRKNGGSEGSPLKNICLRLVHFINRGSRFTYQQIDELIVALHRSILSLQKKKQEMMRRKQKGN